MLILNIKVTCNGLKYFSFKTISRFYSFNQTQLLPTQPIFCNMPCVKGGHIEYISYVWEHLTRHTEPWCWEVHTSRWKVVKNWRRSKCSLITFPGPSLRYCILKQWGG